MVINLNIFCRYSKKKYMCLKSKYMEEISFTAML